jgi:hypothetical protein
LAGVASWGGGWHASSIVTRCGGAFNRFSKALLILHSH